MIFNKILCKDITFDVVIEKMSNLEYQLDNPKSDIDNELSILYEKYSNDQLVKDIKKFISKIWSSIKEIWKELIKTSKKFIKKTERFLRRSIINLDNKLYFDYKAIFTVDDANKHIKRRCRTYNSLLELYEHLKVSLNYIVNLISKNQKIHYTQVKNLEKSLILSNKESIIQEANYHIYTFKLDDIEGYKSSNRLQGAVIQGEDFLNQFNIENFNIFNNIDMNDILKLQDYNMDIINIFKSGIIENIYKIVSDPEYVAVQQKLSSNDFSDNLLLSRFTDEYNKLPENQKKDITNIIHRNFDVYFPPTKEGLENMQASVRILKSKNKVVAEAFNNLMKYDVLSVFIAERDYWNDPLNVEKFKKRYRLDTHRVIKRDGHYLDFSDIGLGSVVLLNDTSYFEEIYHKLINTNYSTSLIYMISNFDYTVISHASVDVFNSFRQAMSLELWHNKDNYSLFKECYKKQIKLCEDHLGVPFEQITDEMFSNLVRYILAEDNTVSNNDKMNFAYFCRSIYNQWNCMPVFIPNLNKTLTNIEMIIYDSLLVDYFHEYVRVHYCHFIISSCPYIYL